MLIVVNKYKYFQINSPYKSMGWFLYNCMFKGTAMWIMWSQIYDCFDTNKKH